MGGARRFAVACGLGFFAAPFLATSSTVWCTSALERTTHGGGGDAPGKTHLSADGLSNALFAHDPPPTMEELQYVKTWGTRWVDDWDRPGLRTCNVGPGSTPRRQILLIRHGQYQNENTHDDTIRTLTPLGQAQARMTGLYLRRSFEQEPKLRALRERRRDARRALTQATSTTESEMSAESLDELRAAVQAAELAERAQGNLMVSPEPRTIYVSDMTRAKQTAHALLEAFPDALRTRLVVDPDLRERFPCDPQPPYHRSANARDMRLAEDVFARYFHRPLTDESTVDVIVGHGNVIRYLTLRALQLPPEAWLRTTLPHCSVTSLTINHKGHVKLVGWGSYGHLPPDMVTVNNIP